MERASKRVCLLALLVGVADAEAAAGHLLGVGDAAFFGDFAVVQDVRDLGGGRQLAHATVGREVVVADFRTEPAVERDGVTIDGVVCAPQIDRSQDDRAFTDPRGNTLQVVVVPVGAVGCAQMGVAITPGGVVDAEAIVAGGQASEAESDQADGSSEANDATTRAKKHESSNQS